jgi:hypothetical protein
MSRRASGRQARQRTPPKKQDCDQDRAEALKRQIDGEAEVARLAWQRAEAAARRAGDKATDALARLNRARRERESVDDQYQVAQRIAFLLLERLGSGSEAYRIAQGEADALAEQYTRLTTPIDEAQAAFDVADDARDIAELKMADAREAFLRALSRLSDAASAVQALDCDRLAQILNEVREQRARAQQAANQAQAAAGP